MGSQDDPKGDGPITEADLHAWLDGELPPRRAACVEAYLAEHPEDLERLERYQAQGDLLARAYAPLAGAAFAPPPARRALRRAAIAAAAAAALFLSGVGAGWFAHGDLNGEKRSPPPSAADALAAHRVFVADIRHPVEVAADQEAHLIAWLSRRLGKPVTAPRLDALGFALMGGRLLPSANGPAAQFMYQNAAGERVTLFVTPSAETGEVAFRFHQDGAAAAFYWRDRGFSWALAGDADRAQLQALAQAVYAALNA